jgi:DNA-directed RNA polymerase subunit beta
MAYTEQKIKRTYIGKDYRDVMDIPDLIDIQLSSYERFLQRDKLRKNLPLDMIGLEEVFRTTFPIESPSGDLVIEYERYSLDEKAIKYSELECKQKGLTYSVPLKAVINLVFKKTGEIRQKEIYLGDIPLMTDRGTFIINGAERVIVSQIHRSPGVVFSHEKGVFSARIIPYRGSWLEFEIDQKHELIHAKIDRKRKILGTMFLRAIGLQSREEIIAAFYTTKEVRLSEGQAEKDALVGKILAKAVYIELDGEQKRLFRAGDKIHLHEIDELINLGIDAIDIIDFEDEKSLHNEMILNCFEREDVKLVKETPEDRKSVV